MQLPKHTCAVCPKPIGSAFLMCYAHWRLVPKDQATALTRAYGAMERSGASYPARVRLELINKYREAREAVIAAVKSQLEEGTRP